MWEKEHIKMCRYRRCEFCEHGMQSQFFKENMFCFKDGTHNHKTDRCIKYKRDREKIYISKHPELYRA